MTGFTATPGRTLFPRLLARVCAAGLTSTLLWWAPAAWACSEISPHIQARIDQAPTEAIEVTVAEHGGQISLRAEEGHEVTVLGLDGEPWIRSDATGTWWRNTNAMSHHTSCAEENPCAAPQDLPTEPAWEQLLPREAHTYYDSRTFPYTDQVPADLLADPSQHRTLWTFEVPVIIDEQRTAIRGTLTWTPGEDADASAAPHTPMAATPGPDAFTNTWGVAPAGVLLGLSMLAALAAGRHRARRAVAPACAPSTPASQNDS